MSLRSLSLNSARAFVLDNLSSHKAKHQAATEAAGATLMFLPPYSPI